MSSMSRRPAAGQGQTLPPCSNAPGTGFHPLDGAEAAVRETREESGIECQITGLPPKTRYGQRTLPLGIYRRNAWTTCQNSRDRHTAPSWPATMLYHP